MWVVWVVWAVCALWDVWDVGGSVWGEREGSKVIEGVMRREGSD